MLTYNYLRFDNPFEYGFKWTTGILDYRIQKIFDPTVIPINSYYYFLHPPKINSQFPFAHLEPSWANYNLPLWNWNSRYIVERVGGLIPCIPFTLLFLVFLIFKFLLKKDIDQAYIEKHFPCFEFYIIFIPAILNLIVCLLSRAVSMRYVADFAPYFVVCSCIIWFYLNSIFTFDPKFSSALNGIIFVLAIISILFGIAFSISGYYDNLSRYNPSEFAKIESWFKSLSKVISKVAPLWGQH